MALAVAALTLTSCGSGAGGQGADAQAGATLVGRDFVAAEGMSGVAATDDGAPRTILGQMRLSFANGSISGTGGCNTFSGSGSVTDGELRISGSLASTEMACDPAVMRQDAWFIELLQGTPKVAIDGELLSIVGAISSAVLIDRKAVEPDLPLQGTRWTLTGIVTGDAASSVPQGVTATIIITGDQLAVDTGCNTGSQKVTVQPGDPIVGEDTHVEPGSAGRVSLGPLGLTKMGCTGPDAEVESAITATLTGPVLSYTISGSNVVLNNPSNKTGLTFSGSGNG